MGIAIIVAVAENGVIGADGGMPWHIADDLKRFKALTLGKPMIMGRATFASLPGLLPGRCHIVLSRNANWAAPGAEVVPNWETAVARARDAASGEASGEIMVIGGAKVIALALPHADTIHLTRVHARPEGDTHLNGFPPPGWRVKQRQAFAAIADTPGYEFIDLYRGCPKHVD